VALQLYYTAGSLRTLFHVSYGNAATEADGAKPDDVEGPIKDYLVHGKYWAADSPDGMARSR
jgi:hypothetical protein